MFILVCHLYTKQTEERESYQEDFLVGTTTYIDIK